MNYSANATIIDYKWSSYRGTPLVEGFVDTSKDALFISKVYQWTPGSRRNLLVPDLSDTSMFDNGLWELTAIDEKGSKFDIPDNWDGDINAAATNNTNRWGFASNISVQDMSYINGKYVEENPYFTFYMGVGMLKGYLSKIDSFIYIAQSSPDFEGRSFTSFSHYAAELSFDKSITLDPNLVKDPQLTQSSFAVVRTVRVSEASSWALFSLALLFLRVARGN